MNTPDARGQSIAATARPFSGLQLAIAPSWLCFCWEANGDSIVIKTFCLISLVLISGRAFGERINHEGRILGPLPVVTNSILFNTPEADTILSAMQIFPTTNAWNEDISRRPVLTNSDAMIAQIISDLATDRRTLIAFFEMNFVLVPDSQPPAPINFDLSPEESYPGESDPSPYPIPANMPIETWPRGTGALTLSQWQRDSNNNGGDRHAIIAQPGNGLIWETWHTKVTNSLWQAASGAKFNLNTNGLRQLDWTSADAAGLPMFPALPRFDECERGMVEHACRVVVKRTRREHIYPATHYASSTPATNYNVPAMGQRVRLKSSFVIPAAWTKHEKAVLLALKKYGAIVADNGNFFSISVTPDDRWPANAFSHFTSIGITNFEVIQTTSENEGPRSPGAPTANAGADFNVPLGVPALLQGAVNFSGAPPVIRWKLYSGPGTATFGDAMLTNTTASFSPPGVYTLMLTADDSVHAVAYDAVAVTVTPALIVTIARAGTNLNLTWTGGGPPFVVERNDYPIPSSWSGVITTSSQNASVPLTPGNAFFRVKGQ